MFIYLAGKIDYAEGKSWQSDIMTEINCNAKLAHNFYNPSTAFNIASKDACASGVIKQINDGAIAACDIIVALIDKTMSIGTIIELFENANRSHNQKKPLIVYDQSGKDSLYLTHLKPDVVVKTTVELIEAINRYIFIDIDRYSYL